MHLRHVPCAAGTRQRAMGDRQAVGAPAALPGPWSGDRRVLIINNPAAGRPAAHRAVMHLSQRLRALGWRVEGASTTHRGHATTLAAAAVAERYDLVVAAGGDGTINEVVQALAGTDTALGVLPVGTVNVWAAEAGIPADPDRVAALLDGGSVRNIDVGTAAVRQYPDAFHPEDTRYQVPASGRGPLDGVTAALTQWPDAPHPEGHPEGTRYPVLANGSGSSEGASISTRYFLLMAGVGFDASVVQGVTPDLKRRLGRWAYALTMAGVARGYAGTPISLRLDDVELRSTALMLVIGNSRRYAGSFRLTPRAMIDDGQLDVCLVPGRRLARSPAQVGAVLTGTTLLRWALRDYRAARIAIEAAQPLPVQVDGDFAGWTPAQVAVMPRALRVVVPAYRANGLFLQGAVGDGRRSDGLFCTGGSRR